MFNKIFTVVVLVLLSLQSFAVNAETKERGQVLKVSGDVTVIDADGNKRQVKGTDEKINEMDTVVTEKNGRIVMRFDDGSLSALSEKSRLRIEKTSWFSYLGGKVYFTFKKVFGGEKRHVRTSTATIGIRGTTFILDKDAKTNTESVALKEGLLQVKSLGDEFEIHKQKELSDYEKFKLEQQAMRQQTQNEFDQYKKQLMQEFVQYKKEFTLRPNRVISLSGNRVDETAMSAAYKKDFKEFESESADLIKQFRAK